MSYGFEFINNDAAIAIDQNFQNFAVHASGSTAPDSKGQLQINYPSCIAPFVFVNFPVGYNITIGIVTSTYARFTINNRTQSSYGAFTGAVPWVVLAVLPSAATATGYGLAVYNSAGTIVFSTGHNYLRWRENIDFITPPVYPDTPTVDRSHGSYTTPYFCAPYAGPLGEQGDGENVPYFAYWTRFIRTSSTNLRFTFSVANFFFQGDWWADDTINWAFGQNIIPLGAPGGANPAAPPASEVPMRVMLGTLT